MPFFSTNLQRLIIDPKDAIVKVCSVGRVVVEQFLKFLGPVPLKPRGCLIL